MDILYLKKEVGTCCTSDKNTPVQHKKYMKILDFSGDNTGTLNFVVKLKDVEDGD